MSNVTEMLPGTKEVNSDEDAAYQKRRGSIEAACAIRKMFYEELSDISYVKCLDRVMKAGLTRDRPRHWEGRVSQDELIEFLSQCIYERGDIVMDREMAFWPNEGPDSIRKRIYDHIAQAVGLETWHPISCINDLPTLSAIEAELERISNLERRNLEDLVYKALYPSQAS